MIQVQRRHRVYSTAPERTQQYSTTAVASKQAAADDLPCSLSRWPHSRKTAKPIFFCVYCCTMMPVSVAADTITCIVTGKPRPKAYLSIGEYLRKAGPFKTVNV